MLLLIAGLFVLLPGTLMADSREVCNIGVLAHRGPEMAIRMWTPTVDYLSSQITDYDFRLVPLDLDEMHAAEERGELDFILTNPGNYVELEAHHGVSRIATLINARHGGPSTMFEKLVALTRGDDDELRRHALETLTAEDQEGDCHKDQRQLRQLVELDA